MSYLAAVNNTHHPMMFSPDKLNTRIRTIENDD